MAHQKWLITLLTVFLLIKSDVEAFTALPPSSVLNSRVTNSLEFSSTLLQSAVPDYDVVALVTGQENYGLAVVCMGEALWSFSKAPSLDHAKILIPAGLAAVVLGVVSGPMLTSGDPASIAMGLWIATGVSVGLGASYVARLLAAYSPSPKEFAGLGLLIAVAGFFSFSQNLLVDGFVTLPSIDLPSLPSIEIPNPFSEEVPTVEIPATEVPAPVVPTAEIAEPEIAAPVELPPMEEVATIEIPAPEVPAAAISAPEVAAPVELPPAEEVATIEIPAPEAPAPEVPTEAVSAPEVAAPIELPPTEEVVTVEIPAPEVAAPEISAPEIAATVESPPTEEVVTVEIPSTEVPAPEISEPEAAKMPSYDF